MLHTLKSRPRCSGCRIRNSSRSRSRSTFSRSRSSILWLLSMTCHSHLMRNDLDLCLFLWYFWLGVNLPIEEPPCLLRGILDLDLPRSRFFANFEQHQSNGRACPSAVFWPQIARIETLISVWIAVQYAVYNRLPFGFKKFDYGVCGPIKGIQMRKQIYNVYIYYIYMRRK